MTRLAKAALVVFLALGSACKHTQEAPTPPTHAVRMGPGFAVSLLALAQGALGCLDETIVWAVTEANGGVVTSEGLYTAPACGANFAAGTYHVTATGCTKSTTFAIEVAEAVTSVSVACAVIAPATCCKAPPIQVAPGGTARFYAAVNYTCHTAYSPSAPPAMCP